MTASTSFSPACTRRTTLRLAVAALATPFVIPAVPAAEPKPVTPVASSGRWDRRVVLVELRGGNDGLNTVVPVGDRAYYKARSRLAIPEAAALRLGQIPFGLHPALAPLQAAWTEGDLAFVHGLGYANPNRSHFRGIDIWNQATDAERLGSDGWLARVLRDGGPPPSDLLAEGIIVGYGSTVAYGGFGPLQGSERVLAFDSPEDLVRRAKILAPAGERSGPPALARLESARDGIVRAAAALETLAKRSKIGAGFPNSGFGRQCAQAARLICAEAQVPFYKLTLDGFDTHPGQLDRHRQLLSDLAGGLAALRAACIQAKVWDRVVVATYGEFGRRLAENDSLGTDHGTSSVHAVFGGKVKGGMYGRHPDLTRLQDEDPVFTTDYRCLYQSLASDWWGWKGRFASAAPVRGLGLIRT